MNINCSHMENFHMQTNVIFGVYAIIQTTDQSYHKRKKKMVLSHI